MEGLGPGDWGAGEESFKRFAGCPLGSGMGLAGTEDEEGQGRFEAEAAARCINFIVSRREDIVLSCFPLTGVLDPDMGMAEPGKRIHK